MPAANNRRLSVEELCAKYDNEDVHTEHVTALALQLFDLLRARLELPAHDRPLLEAAGRLHDIGYGVSPRRHAELSAEIVLREGLRGFRESQRAYIAAAIPFHASGRKPKQTHPLLERVPDAPRALRLAAILRVADGLDHGHLQDAIIAGMRASKRKIAVRVRSPHLPHNAEAANRKADLWRAVFPVDIQFALLPPKKGARAELIGPGLHVCEAARRLMFRQFRIVTMNVEGALRGEDPEHLHDIRVAIRRLRALLRAFRKPLTGTSAEELDLELKELNNALGTPRDLDVWVEFLRSTKVQRNVARNRRWKTFIAHQQALRRLQLPTVRRHLGGPRFRALRFKLGRFLRTELPRRIEQSPPGLVPAIARSAMRKALRRALKLSAMRKSESPEDLHRLRIALRRVRYFGQFFATLLGPPFPELTERTQAVEQVLGRIHDLDVSIARVQREGPPPPRLLAKHLRQRRDKAVVKLARLWQRFDDREMQADARRRLKA